MRRLSVFIEINGQSEYAGEIIGRDSSDAKFPSASFPKITAVGRKIGRKKSRIKRKNIWLS